MKSNLDAYARERGLPRSYAAQELIERALAAADIGFAADGRTGRGSNEENPEKCHQNSPPRPASSPNAP
ncbi:MAG TPA: hypothetical protein VMU40_07770 [Steroidobacteraceae bacterium]|nr:hypothetical protein [Steroidobacteraceae bacterium]